MGLIKNLTKLKSLLQTINMKKIILHLLSAIGTLSPTFSSAADYYFIPTSKDNIDWNHLENWKISEDGGQSLADATNYPSASDNVFFDQTKITLWPDGKGMNWYFDGNIEMDSLTITGNLVQLSFGAYNKTAETASTSSLIVNGNMSVILDGAGEYDGKYLMGGQNNPLSVQIKGDVELSRLNNTGTLTFSFGGNSQSNALKSLKIDGNFNNKTGQISFGSYVCKRDAAKIAEDKYYYYKNADIQIGGSITGNSTLFLNSTGTNNVIIKVNGITSTSIDMRATNDNEGKVGSSATIVLANEGQALMKGGITDLYSYREGQVGKKTSNTVVDVVMMGAQNSQQKLVLSSDKRAFRGGVTVISGDLRMYTMYKNNTAEGEWGKWGDIRLVGNSDGIEAKFGAIGSNGSETDSNAVVYGDNLIWTGGTIVSGIINQAQASLIELSGMMQKGEGAGSEFWFEFVGNTNYLTEDGVSIKLISWTEGNTPTDFHESEFKAANIDGKIAEFTIADDGLYVSYTVPEPAAVAALVGAVALLFALRRKK